VPDSLQPIRPEPVGDLRRWLADQSVAIFLFHGVVAGAGHPVRNYTRKHLPVGEFSDMIDALCGAGEPVSMDDVVAASGGTASLPPRAFCITFDDGFENNFSVAAPALERRNVPAMFYVTTGFVDEGRCSWIDLIEYAFEARDIVDLDLPQIGIKVSSRTAGEKRAVLDRIRTEVKGRPAVDPYEIADAVWRQLDVRQMTPDPELDAKMSWSQLAELARHPLFTVGGHSHTHRILSFLSPADLADELDRSLSLLTTHVGPIEHYSYPEGLSHCYSDQVIAALKQRRIVCAPTAEAGTNTTADDLFRLKRIMVS
jgi:peptidoglycan/xylan/chitin deacetylase (PgdA/CDA1 family)